MWSAAAVILLLAVGAGFGAYVVSGARATDQAKLEAPGTPALAPAEEATRADCCADPTCVPGCCPECPPDCCMITKAGVKAKADCPPCPDCP
jgi:hypothetical protein